MLPSQRMGTGGRIPAVNQLVFALHVFVCPSEVTERE
jgi:hypothetical protein